MIDERPGILTDDGGEEDDRREAEAVRRLVDSGGDGVRYRLTPLGARVLAHRRSGVGSYATLGVRSLPTLTGDLRN